MSTESADAIDAAIQSAESLFASLLDRGPSAPGRLQSGSLDPESSLLPTALGPASPEGSIVSVGTASLDPAQLTANSHAIYENFDPKESLSAIITRRSQTSISSTPSYDTLYKVLQERERDLELAAHIGQQLLKRNDLLECDLGAVVDHRQALEQQVAQLTHTIAQKEELLRLYASDARERDQAEAEVTEDRPEWVVALTEECRELRESNATLKMEADQLRRETADIETKERELVQQCLEQFSEAKRTLAEMRERSEESFLENQALQAQLDEVKGLYGEEQVRSQQVTEEGEVLREQLAEAQDAIAHLTNEVTELNEQFNMTSVLLKEANDEITALKEISLQSSSSPADTGEEQHESIVKEIEEALRKEIHAASMLEERPRSPNHYARQRTMVVMETVRAATLATARRLERLATEAKSSDVGFKPVAASSPNTSAQSRNRPSKLPRPSPLTRSTPSRITPLRKATPPSPIPSESPASEDPVKYRSPQKLQIVKPMEGSVTLLKWKLLATPQLGGAKSFFSNAATPGVHLKKWPASGIRDAESIPDERAEVPYDTRMAVSAMDLRELNTTYLPARTPAHVRRHKATPTKTQREDKTESSEEAEGQRSLLSQFGSFLGSGLSRLKFRGQSSEPQTPPPVSEHTDEGLGGLL